MTNLEKMNLILLSVVIADCVEMATETEKYPGPELEEALKKTEELRATLQQILDTHSEKQVTQ